MISSLFENYLLYMKCFKNAIAETLTKTDSFFLMILYQ